MFTRATTPVDESTVPVLNTLRDGIGFASLDLHPLGAHLGSSSGRHGSPRVPRKHDSGRCCCGPWVPTRPLGFGAFARARAMALLPLRSFFASNG